MKKLITNALFLAVVLLGLNGQDTPQPFHRFWYHNKVGLLNSNLEVVIEPKYEEMSYPSEGYITTKKDSKTWMILDMEGTEILSLKADRVYPVSHGLVLATLDYGTGTQDRDVFLDLQGRNVFNREFVTAVMFSQGRAAVSKSSEWDDVVLMDINGTLLKMKPQSYIRPFSEGLAAVRSKDYLDGYIDTSGQWVIPPVWGETKDFRHGLAQVRDWDGTYFIDTSGEVVISFKPEELDILPDERWFMVSQYISDDGYARAMGSTDGHAPNPWDTRTLYYYRDGSIAFISPFPAIGEDFFEGLAGFAGMVDGKLTYGYWNARGEIELILPSGYVLPQHYDSFAGYTCDFKQGWAAIMQKDHRTGVWEGWAFINKAGQVVRVADIMEAYNADKDFMMDYENHLRFNIRRD